MVTLRPPVDRRRLRALLREHFAGDLSPVRVLTGGQVARTFAFRASGRPYIIRFGHLPHAFARDRYAGEHFAAPDLPIPRVVTLGQFDGLQYAISERLPGRPLTRLPVATLRSVFPLLLDALDRLHRIDVANGQGFGVWREDGVGHAASWRDHLAAIDVEEADGYWAGWRALFDTSFLERDLFERSYDRMLRLADYCPEERGLVHGDFGFDNALSDSARITGILDWANVAYGDPLFDVAWLAFWSNHPAIDALLRERYAPTTPRYRERLACYEYRIGLDGLRFFAKANQLPAYGMVRGRLLGLEAQSGNA